MGRQEGNNEVESGSINAGAAKQLNTESGTNTGSGPDSGATTSENELSGLQVKPFKSLIAILLLSLLEVVEL